MTRVEGRQGIWQGETEGGDLKEGIGGVLDGGNRGRGFGRGRKGRECKFQNKEHKTFDPRINFAPSQVPICSVDHFFK